jgi:hypothetical protein
MRRHPILSRTMLRSTRAAMIHHINSVFAQCTAYCKRLRHNARYMPRLHFDTGTPDCWTGVEFRRAWLNPRPGLAWAKASSDCRGVS